MREGKRRDGGREKEEGVEGMRREEGVEGMRRAQKGTRGGGQQGVGFSRSCLACGEMVASCGLRLLIGLLRLLPVLAQLLLLVPVLAPLLLATNSPLLFLLVNGTPGMGEQFPPEWLLLLFKLMFLLSHRGDDAAVLCIEGDVCDMGETEPHLELLLEFEPRGEGVAFPSHVRGSGDARGPEGDL